MRYKSSKDIDKHMEVNEETIEFSKDPKGGMHYTPPSPMLPPTCLGSSLPSTSSS